MDSLLGITYEDWKNLLSVEGNFVEKEYKGRKRFLTLFSLFNSRYKKKEDEQFGHKIENVQIKEPVFILGHWRSGTTLVHNVLCMDKQFGFSNKFQNSHPYSFLTREAAVSKALEKVPAEKRRMDNITVTFQSPDEDENAISIMSQRSPIIGWAFTKNQSKYAKYHTFRNADEADFNRWKSAMITYYKKLTFRYERPLVLKSPVHLGRMKIFYDQFPDARFIHIYRDPYRVFQSTKKLYATVLPHTCFQKPDLNVWDDHILDNYREMYDQFLEDKKYVPEKQVYEVKFEEFEKDIFGNVAAIYDYFQFPGFFKFESVLKSYVESIEKFEKNKFKALPEQEIERINSSWSKSFQFGNYPMIETHKKQEWVQ